MRIQHNIPALNTHRNLTYVNSNVSKALEKLSSGYRINRAGDDAAGLAISEKMRGRIRGLDMAQKNTQDAISLVQTAEGALTEVHAMLQRGRELATQAANDTNTQFDREKIQEEITQLNAEIDHLADRTEFNTKKLLKGTSSLSISPNGAAATSGGGTVVSDEQIKALTERVLNSMLGQSEKMVQEAYGITPNDKFKVDVSYVDEAEGGRVAWVSVRSEWYVDGLGNKFDMKAFPTDLVLDKADFFSQQEMWVSHDRIIAHEMVHAIMGGAINTFSELPGWFTEGTAEYVAGANERVLGSLQNIAYKDYSKNFSGTNPDITLTQTEKDEAYAKLVSRLGQLDTSGTPNVAFPTGLHEASYTSDAYSAGFVATKFLDNAIQTKDSTKSIKDFMVDLKGGMSFDDTIKKYTNYSGNTALENDFKGANGAAYLKSLVESTTAVFANSTGSILAGRPGYPDTNTGIVPDTNMPSSLFDYNWDASTLYSPSMLIALGGNTGGSDGGTPIELPTSLSGLKFQIGANEGQAMHLDLPDVSAKNLRTDQVNVLTHESAASAITTYDKAINAISAVRSNLGAVQNRLEHTINNLGTASENLTSAESRIRDTDMAKEMMSFTKNNILMQAAQSMLSQANQQPQGVLQLLG